MPRVPTDAEKIIALLEHIRDILKDILKQREGSR